MYLSIIFDTSFKLIFFLINVSILKNISTIAIKNTNDENLLKNMITRINPTTKTIKSIYITTPLIFYLYIVYCIIIFEKIIV